MAFLRHCKNTDKQQSILGSSLLKPWIKLRFNTAIFNFIVRMASRFRKANVLSVRAEENFLKIDVNGADSQLYTTSVWKYSLRKLNFCGVIESNFLM